MNPEAPELSVVVPFFNEEESVERLLSDLRDALEKLSSPYEIVAVDDGSRDRTGLLLGTWAAGDARLRVLGWRRNRGQAAALLHGMQAARGAVLITLDGDGQNDPQDIPELLAALDGADMVVGIRVDRHDSGLRRVMSRLANAVRARMLGDHLLDGGCALKVFRREVVASFLPIRTLYSFMPALAIGAGFRVAQQPVRHRARYGGRTSYGLRQFLWRPALDMLGVWWFLHRRIPAAQEGGGPGES